MSNNPERLSDADLEDVAGGAGKPAPGKKDPAGKTPSTGTGGSCGSTPEVKNPNHGNSSIGGR